MDIKPLIADASWALKYKIITYKLIMDVKELIGLSMLGMVKEPIISKMVGAELLTDKDKNNDLIGLGLMMNNQPMKKFSVYNGSVLK